MRLNVEVDTDLRGLALAARRLTSAKPVLEKIAEDIESGQAERFGKVRFAPLSPAYAAAKARRGLSPRPLAGGALEASITGTGGFHVRRVSDDTVEVGTSDPVARIHSKGRKAGGRGGSMPARRPITNPTKRVREKIADRLGEYVSGL